MHQNYCEQVIRVWDVVLDHDNLSRAIDQTIERIEKSHLRGEDCAIYAELDKSMNDDASAKPAVEKADSGKDLKEVIGRQEAKRFYAAMFEAGKGLMSAEAFEVVDWEALKLTLQQAEDVQCVVQQAVLRMVWHQQKAG